MVLGLYARYFDHASILFQGKFHIIFQRLLVLKIFCFFSLMSKVNLTTCIKQAYRNALYLQNSRKP